jgi:formylglycine-generating enzyme required for sulfatase activity
MSLCAMLEKRTMAAQHSASSIHLRSSIEPVMVPILAGSFLMGSEAGQENERPVHRVWVDSFLLAASQVTNAEYARFLSATGAPPPPSWHDPNFNDPRQPIVAVSWFEAVRYCAWLSAGSGMHYRLPTEAEWERAARAGMEGRLFPWGDDPPQSLPDYSSRWKDGPEPVARYAPNGFGLHDICENVHEWCSDWYGAGYYVISPDRNPHGPETGSRRASRGGSWRHHIKVTRCAARSSIPPQFQYADYGFRVACDLGEAHVSA